MDARIQLVEDLVVAREERLLLGELLSLLGQFAPQLLVLSPQTIILTLLRLAFWRCSIAEVRGGAGQRLQTFTVPYVSGLVPSNLHREACPPSELSQQPLVRRDEGRDAL